MEGGISSTTTNVQHLDDVTAAILRAIMPTTQQIFAGEDEAN